MDFKKLAKDLLAIAEAAAPVVGLGEELAAGKALVETITNVIDTTKDNFESDDQVALQGALDKLAAKVNAHADRTSASLGG